MAELLAPAGSMDSLIAAISNGCDAVYLAMSKFGARAYANNFDDEQILEAINYAHLRNVKVYVTMNTIIYDEELDAAYQQLDYLYQIGADGIIVQDLALFSYIVRNYPQMEAHTSTQMGIDDLEGALLFKELGAKRIVLARETPIDKIKQIKKLSKLPVEVFIHGALCVSYSGNCLMSGLIGYRSGNRGRCVGSCRKKYEVINLTTNEILSNSYILSMKDLNTIENIDELKNLDSLKIEGRMKEPEYVANVVSSYRQALDYGYKKDLSERLNKTFNRTFTKGYIFKEDKKNISNINRPNNFGYKIGEITNKNKLGYEIKLSSILNQNDVIRIDHDGEDINLLVARLYDKNDNFIKSANNYCYIKIKEKLNIGDIVYKTKDSLFYDDILKTYPKEYKRFPINLSIYGEALEHLTITAECDNQTIYLESDFMLEKALNNPTDKKQFIKQFNRLTDTVYSLGEINYYINDCFIPAGKINELRRSIVSLLNEKRILKRESIKKTTDSKKTIVFDTRTPELSVYCTTLEQLEAAKACNINIIYYDQNVIRRNEVTYQDKDFEVLVGGYGGIYYYKNKISFSTDYSLNVVNHEAVYLLHSLGAKRVCLSYEINQKQIKELLEKYQKENGGYPNLEMIVYGKAPLMFTHYCPLKVLNQCGKCHQNQYVIKDEYGSFPIESHKDCTTTILNGHTLNLIDDLENIENINTFRINLTKESKEESIRIINMFLEKIKNKNKTNLFNQKTDTRGHLKKEIL